VIVSDVLLNCLMRSYIT